MALNVYYMNICWQWCSTIEKLTKVIPTQSFDSDYDPMEETVTSILLGISFGCLVFTIIAYLPAKLVALSIMGNVKLTVSLYTKIRLTVPPHFTILHCTDCIPYVILN